MSTVDLSERGLRSLAGRLGYRLGPLEKVVRLVSLLEEVAADTYLRDRVVLKGGTALNIFLSRPARLSIDADLNYIGAVDRDRMLKERPRVIARIIECGEGLGYRAAESRNVYALSELQFRYDSSTGSDDLVKFEVNFIERLSILNVIESRRCLLDIPGERLGVPCLSANEIAGMKLGTLCVRGAPRDLFDVARFNAIPLDKEVVRKVALFRGFLEAVDLSRFNPRAMEAITPKALEDEVVNLLLSSDVVSRDTLIDAAKGWTSGLLPLGKGERDYQTKLAAGVHEPSLLFGTTPFHPALGDHPGMRLRLQRPKRAE